jgi:hypothetical protein
MSFIEKLREEYKRYYKDRQQLTKELTHQEMNLLRSMSKARGLNKDNLSGFFFLDLLHSKALLTPSYIWQTWLYHRFIHHQMSLQPSLSPVLTFSDIYRATEKMVKDGIFRVASNSHLDDVMQLIREYLAVYESLDVLRIDGEFIYLYYDEMPVFSLNEENIYITLYFNAMKGKVRNKPECLDQFPENMQKTIEEFYACWRNSQTNFLIGDQYKFTEQQKRYLGFDLMIYSDKYLLDEALRILTNEQKRAISYYLKQGRYSIFQLCDLLVKRHGASPKKDKTGKYEIYQYVEEYVFSSLWLWNK